VIRQAYLKGSGTLVIDLVTAATRFVVSPEGVITDRKTNLEWIVGPDSNMNYSQAVQWVAGCKVAGGGWRMPKRLETATLYLEGAGTRNIDPLLRTTGWHVWSEPRDSSSAWFFPLSPGLVYWSSRDDSIGYRVFGVCSRR
jgi:hypothetical protein